MDKQGIISCTFYFESKRQSYKMKRIEVHAQWFALVISLQIVSWHGSVIAVSDDIFITEEEAHDFLSRSRRGNAGSILEELKAGNKERECFEELCSKEEAREIWDNSYTANKFWKKYLECQPGRSTSKNRLRACVSDTDDCDPNPCSRTKSLRCVDQIGDYQCVCKPGYTGKRCNELLNECNSNPCGAYGRCEDDIDAFNCICDNQHHGVQCELEIDDCRLFGCENGNCRPVDGGTAYSCQCRKGYQGERCEKDIDECKLNLCDGKCTNTIGGFKCSCSSGYILSSADRTSCVDVNECALTANACEGRCVNTQGGYYCTCDLGYRLDSLYKRYCEDINECNVNNGGCPLMENCGAESCDTCFNTPGNYSCRCPQGFYMDQHQQCHDRDECASSSRHACQHLCVNSQGSFECRCHDGFKLNYDKASCADINECLSMDHGCDYRCVNTIGDYICKCNRGYETKDNRTCNDLDECKSSKTLCDHGCKNTQGSYVCTCNLGYRLIGKYRCVDIRECASNPCLNNGRCIEGINKFTCKCLEGTSGLFCEVVLLSCLNDNPCLHGTCSEAENRLVCSCDTGFMGDDCSVDIDECAIEKGGCAQLCQNTDGSFNCACLDGFELQSNGECRDIDECLRPDLNKCDQACSNNIGSYSCGCQPGYIKKSETSELCIDKDECTLNLCEQLCINEPGSFHCVCNPGYKLSNGFKCVDMDECRDSSSCQQVCTNTVGSYLCSCSRGFDLSSNGRSCVRQVGCAPITTNIYESGSVYYLGKKQDDFIEQRIKKGLRSRFDINFQFRSIDDSGILVACSDSRAKKFFYLQIVEGELKFDYNFGSGITKLSTSDLQVSDGEWHEVSVNKNGKQVEIFYDGSRVLRGTSKKDRFKPGKYIYFGGIVSSSKLVSKVRSDISYEGCLKNIEISHTTVTYDQDEISRTHSGCFHTYSKGVHFVGDGYVNMTNALTSTSTLTFQIKFRAHNGTGTIVYIEDNNRNKISIQLNRNRVIAEVRMSGETYRATFTNDGILCDGLWRIIYCRITGIRITLYVSGRPAQNVIVSGMNFGRLSSPKMFFGGKKSGNLPHFGGSLKDVRLNNRKLNFLQSTGHNNVYRTIVPRDVN